LFAVRFLHCRRHSGEAYKRPAPPASREERWTLHGIAGYGIDRVEEHLREIVYWVDDLFAQAPARPGRWEYEIDYDAPHEMFVGRKVLLSRQNGMDIALN
jgi:hypothetical protein